MRVTVGIKAWSRFGSVKIDQLIASCRFLLSALTVSIQ